MGNFDKAAEIFQILLEETFKDDEKIHSSLYYYLGDIKCHKGNYKEALESYQ
jgi:tetratricopeptide (TPR) repeat protein